MEFLEEIAYCIDTEKNKFNLLGEISRGGQGAVYKTQYGTVVLKLELAKGAFVAENPKSHERFLSLRLLPIPANLNITLPMTILEKYSGYTMKMMDDMTSFKSFFSGEVDNTPVENEWLEQIATANSELAMLFYKLIKRGGLRKFFQAYFYAARILAELHSSGLVYCDFSPNNVFISTDPINCIVWFIDADNLDFQENTSKQIIYTPGIGAPELCDNEVRKGCTFYSDCHAFAASMFQQFTGHNQFEGAAYEEKINECDSLEEADYLRDRGDFAWVFDSEDNSNYWEGGEIFQNLIPEEVMELFDKTFGAGLFKPFKRPSMAEWSYTLAKVTDKIIRCPECQMDRHGGIDSCTWCDCKHTVLEIKTRFEHEDYFWYFAHEIQSDEVIKITMRTVHGFRANEIDDIAFNFKFSKNNLIIQKVSNKFSAEFEDANTPRTESAGFETTEKNFTIYCTDSENLTSVIELRVVNANK